MTQPTNQLLHQTSLSQVPQGLPGDLLVNETPLIMHPLSAGFPSPAADYAADGLDLNSYLIQNKPATFMFTVRGESMIVAGIHHGDKVVVDRA